MSFIQTNYGFYIRQGARFFTSIKELRGRNNMFISKCDHFRTIGIPSKNLAELRSEFKNFSLMSFDEWRNTSEVKTTWQKKTISNTINIIIDQNIGQGDLNKWKNHSIQNGLQM